MKHKSDSNMEWYIIGSRIRRLRREKKWKQKELASRICVDRTSLSAYENGKRLPDVYKLCRIADVFGVSLDELVGRKVPEKEFGKAE